MQRSRDGAPALSSAVAPAHGENAGGDTPPRWGGGRSALDALTHRVLVLTGHFGSGKTEIAVNLALGFAERGGDVVLVDLDVVKPYFRCRVVTEDLESRGVRVVTPRGDRLYADLPIVVPDVRRAAREGRSPRARCIMDVGGHDLGARVLGSLSDAIDRTATEVLFVVNVNRPFAGDVSSLREMLLAVQASARLAVTGLVANTHLLDETTWETVCEGIRAARDLEAATGIPLRFCAVPRRLAEVSGTGDGSPDPLPVLAVERYIVAPFAPRPPGARSRSRVV